MVAHAGQVQDPPLLPAPVSLDPHQIRTLVGAQLRLDLRHPRTGAVRASRAALTVVSYLFSSVILVLSLADRGAGLEEVLFSGLSFAIVLAAFGVAGSYDDLMGRPRDHARIAAFPVSEATLYVARLLNVGGLAAVMSGSAALPLAALAGWQHGAATGLTVGGAVVGVMLATTFAVLGVIWALTLAAPVRTLRTALSGARAALIGALVLGYQWVATQDALSAAAPWWPPRWTIDALWHGDAAAAAALSVFGLVLAAAFGLVFPGRYVRVLTRTAEAESDEYDAAPSPSAPNRWERMAVRAPEPRAAFGFAVSALRADRLVRGRVWPATLLAFIFAAFGWWVGGLGDLFVYGPASVLFEPAVQLHASVLTVLLFSAQAAMQAMQFSSSVEGAWVFGVLPVRSRRALQLGAQQALVARVLVPLHAGLALLLALSMPLLHAAVTVAFWLAGCMLLTRLQALFQREAPFSRHSDRFSAAERFIPLVMAVPAALGLLLLQMASFGSVASAALMVIGLLVLHAGLGRLVLGGLSKMAPAETTPLPQQALA